MVIAVDFDGCITDKNIFPNIGPMKEHAIAALKNLQCHGHKIILWTCREGKYLEEAVNALQQEDLFVDGVNFSPYQLQSRKIVADIYVDDKNVFMVDDVDWYRIEKYILNRPDNNVEIKKYE